MVAFLGAYCTNRGPRKRSPAVSKALKLLRTSSTDAALTFATSTSAEESVHVLDALLRNAPDIQAAEGIIAAHPRPTAHSYAALVHAYKRIGDLRGAEGVLGRMRRANIKPDAEIYNIILTLYVKECNHKKTLRKFVEFQRAGMKADVNTYNALMRSAKRQDASKVWDYFNQMLRNGISPTTISFSTLIDAVGRAGDITYLVDIPDMMLEHKVTPNVFTYTSLMSIYARLGDVENVRKWFDKIAEVGLKRNVVAYGILLDTLNKAGNVDEAEKTFKEMQQEQIRVNEQILTIMMRSRSEAGDIDGVKQLFRMLDSPGRFRYNVLIHALGMNGNISEASLVLRTMQREGVSPDVVTYNTMMKMRADTGDLEGVRRYFHEMEQSGLTPDGFSRAILVDALGSAGELKEAMAVDLLPEDTVPRNILLRFLSDAGDIDATKKTIAKSRTRNSYHDIFLFRAYANAGDWERANQIYHAISPLNSEAATAHLKLLGEKGKVAEVRDAMQTAFEQGFQPKEEMITALINAYGNSGRFGEAVKVLTEMERAYGIKPGMLSYTALMGVQRNREGRHKVLQKILQANLVPKETTFRVMWSSAMEEGDLDDAFEVLEKMLKHGVIPHVSLYNKLIVAYGNRRDLAKVEALVAAVGRLGKRPSVVTYNALMDAFGKTMRSPLGAERLLNDMLKVGVEPDTVTFNTLAAAYARAADPVGVEQVVARMRDRNLEPDKFTYSSMILANKRAGKAAEAQRLADDAKRKGFL